MSGETFLKQQFNEMVIVRIPKSHPLIILLKHFQWIRVLPSIYIFILFNCSVLRLLLIWMYRLFEKYLHNNLRTPFAKLEVELPDDPVCSSVGPLPGLS